MAAKPNCGFCKSVINELEPVRCGLCELFFHLNQDCCGFTSKSSKELFKSGKAMFFCSGCCVILNGRSMRAFIEEIKASSAPPVSVVDDLTNQLKQLTNTVATLGGKVDALTAQQKTVGSTSTQFASIVAGSRGTKRRRSATQSAPAPKMGTKTVVFEKLSITNITPKPDPPRFWLYLTGFNPMITDDDIKLIVSQCLSMPDLQPDITRLVKKGADTSKLSFVSFRVGLDPEHKRLALEDIWPEGISFREFEDWSKNSKDLPPAVCDANFPSLNSASPPDSPMQ